VALGKIGILAQNPASCRLTPDLDPPPLRQEPKSLFSDFLASERTWKYTALARVTYAGSRIISESVHASSVAVETRGARGPHPSCATDNRCHSGHESDFEPNLVLCADICACGAACKPCTEYYSFATLWRSQSGRTPVLLPQSAPDESEEALNE